MASDTVFAKSGHAAILFRCNLLHRVQGWAGMGGREGCQFPEHISGIFRRSDSFW